MKIVCAADTPPWPDWTVTARIASVASALASALARYRERRATFDHFDHREADSSLNPAIATLRDLAAASGTNADTLAKAADHLAAAQRCLDNEWREGLLAMTWDDQVKVVSAALAAAREHLQKVEGSIVGSVRAAIDLADRQFDAYVTGGHRFALDVHDPHVVAADATACAAFALAAVELNAAGTALATAAGELSAARPTLAPPVGDGAASAAHAAHLAADLAASLAHAMTHRPPLP